VRAVRTTPDSVLCAASHVQRARAEGVAPLARFFVYTHCVGTHCRLHSPKYASMIRLSCSNSSAPPLMEMRPVSNT
jgi:hypothetical protein